MLILIKKCIKKDVWYTLFLFHLIRSLKIWLYFELQCLQVKYLFWHGSEVLISRQIGLTRVECDWNLSNFVETSFVFNDILNQSESRNSKVIGDSLTAAHTNLIQLIVKVNSLCCMGSILALNSLLIYLHTISDLNLYVCVFKTFQPFKLSQILKKGFKKQITIHIHIFTILHFF